MNSLTVTVRRATPVPWACGENEWAWRRRVAEAARRVRASNEPQDVSQWAIFSVEVTFWMGTTRIGLADLDNLAKPVLDTLFRIRRPQVKDLRLTGVLFDVDDARVFGLTLKKLPAERSAE